MVSNWPAGKPKPSSCRRGSRPAGSAKPIWRRRLPPKRHPSRRSRKEPHASMIATSADSELDTGPRAPQLERMWVATRTVKPVADMIRFVIGPEGEAVPDLKRKLPGRGVWVTATQEVLADAIKRKALARGFKRDVR